MTKAPVFQDSFYAIAEPRRRQMLDLLREGERPVNDMVISLGWSQPMVSKQLGVLRGAGLVIARRQGRQRVYRINADRLKPVHEWLKTYEQFWKNQLGQIKARAEMRAKKIVGNRTGNP
jgi:DNA-binding transcriptional ArsR family regulator